MQQMFCWFRFHFDGNKKPWLSLADNKEGRRLSLERNKDYRNPTNTSSQPVSINEVLNNNNSNNTENKESTKMLSREAT